QRPNGYLRITDLFGISGRVAGDEMSGYGKGFGCGKEDRFEFAVDHNGQQGDTQTRTDRTDRLRKVHSAVVVCVQQNQYTPLVADTPHAHLTGGAQFM